MNQQKRKSTSKLPRHGCKKKPLFTNAHNFQNKQLLEAFSPVNIIDIPFNDISDDAEQGCLTQSTPAVKGIVKRRTSRRSSSRRRVNKTPLQLEARFNLSHPVTTDTLNQHELKVSKPINKKQVSVHNFSDEMDEIDLSDLLASKTIDAAETPKIVGDEYMSKTIDFEGYTCELDRLKLCPAIQRNSSEHCNLQNHCSEENNILMIIIKIIIMERHQFQNIQT